MVKSNLIGIKDLNLDDINAIFKKAQSFLPNLLSKKPFEPILKGNLVINLFFEHSTRTLTSFEIAAKNLGASVININVAESSLNKGETIFDTIANLDAMKPNFIIIRHKESGIMPIVAKYTNAHIINAGDGTNEHPTQGLLDVFTIKQHFPELKNLNIVICGDILHSRVARSNVALLKMFGANIRLVGPKTLLPSSCDWPLYHNLDDAIKNADVIMMLRIQVERMRKAMIPSAVEYSRFYGLNHQRLKTAKSNALVMHPGPVNRNVEIASALVDDHQNNIILDQVTNGVAIRQAVLAFLGAK